MRGDSSMRALAVVEPTIEGLAARCASERSHPYSRLTPDTVLNALESVGLALRRAPPRVEQLREPRLPGGPRGRPARWSPSSTGPRAGATRRSSRSTRSARELAAAEIPVVAPLALAGAHAAPAPRLPLRGLSAPRRARARARGREHARMARAASSGASTRSAARAPSSTARALDIASFGDEPRAFLLASGLIPPDLVAAWKQASDLALEGVRHASSARARCRDDPPARRLPREQRAVDARHRQRAAAARTSSTSTTAAWRPRCRTCGC